MTQTETAHIGRVRDFDPETCAWVMDLDAFAGLLGAVTTAEEVVIDLETTGLGEYAWGVQNGGVPARIVLASLTLPQAGEDELGVEPTTWIVPLSHPESPWRGRWRTVMTRIAQTIRDEEKPVSNQNTKFDTRWIAAHTGIDLAHLIVWDTKTASHLLDENSSTRLKDRAPKVFGVPAWNDFDLSTPGAAERVPLIDLGLYAARDTYWTWRLEHMQKSVMFLQGDEEVVDQDDIENARLGRVAVWCAMPTHATLAAIEARGMVLDVDWTLDQLSEHKRLAAETEMELSGRYPSMDPKDASFAPTSNWFRAWAECAVAAGDLRIAALTPSGKPQWSKGVLTRQARAGSEVAEWLLDYRGHSKKAEFLTSWLGYTSKEGRIHCTYNDGRVVTGRLSSSDPNMQQVTASLKPAFVPSPGYYFADFDYSQIELRVAAHISECRPMIEAFREGRDLHTMLASRITEKDEADVLPHERQAGKSANFGLLYMMGAYGFREYAETVYGVSFTLEEATAVRAAFFDQWDGIAAWHTKAIERARRTGQVVSPIGRVRRLPGVWSDDDRTAAYAERNAVNSPVQGFASDLMQMAAASVEGTLPGVHAVPGVRLVGTVHDSILAEVPIDTWQATVAVVQERMINLDRVLKRLDCNLLVPLAVDVKVGTRWGLNDVKETA